MGAHVYKLKIKLSPLLPSTPILIHRCFVVSRLQRELKRVPYGTGEDFGFGTIPSIGNNVTQVGGKKMGT